MEYRLPFLNGIDQPLLLERLQVSPDPLILRVAQPAAGKVDRYSRKVRRSRIAERRSRVAIVSPQVELLGRGPHQ
jgi:hypothetical protein